MARTFDLHRHLRLLIWNVAWAGPGSSRGALIRKAIQRINPDILCLTETREDFLPTEGYGILSHSDYGYGTARGRRKVALWSQLPWSQVDSHGSDELPGGRFITGVTGGIRMFGVCIPWQHAHVRTGRRDRAPWEDHLAYLRALRPVLERYSSLPEPVCMAGDFNQRIPRRLQPEPVYQELAHTLGENLKLATGGMVDEHGAMLIDHIATDRRLSCRVEKIISRFGPNGEELSDHVGISASINPLPGLEAQSNASDWLG
ncbi:MAG: endonuclease/exonuclease/phosphatase family protein [Opitutaceae bacterium]|nr:endonuclease/exonuclease/phosphatase family protein [Opitutaceae bacterium]